MRALAAQIAGVQRAVTFKYGTVTATPGTDVVTVNVNGTELDLPYLVGYTPKVNQTVLILAMGNRWVVQDALATPAAPTTPGIPATPPSTPPPKPPPDPTPPKVTYTKTFLATATACFRDGKWRTDTSNQPHQGDWNGAYGRNTGCWFYGTQMANALAGASIIKAEVYLKRIGGGEYGTKNATMWTHTHKSKPSGAPNLLISDTLAQGVAVNSTRWCVFSNSLAAQLATGAAFGLACWVNADAPYMVFANLSSSRSSGALRITYRK